MTTRPRRRMRFVGVSTAQSSIMTVFPRWSQLLDLNADLVGLDVPLDASRRQYRQVVAELRDDPSCVGALVTTHKIGVYEAASDLFTGLDEFAVTCGEVSSVSVRNGQAFGAAKDPLTAGLSLEEVLAPGHFTEGAEVLCLGAGGAGTAIGWYLSQRPDVPQVLRFVDTVPERLSHLAAVIARHRPAAKIETGLLGDADVRQLLRDLPPSSLVINATGMGKDRPGSPLPPDAVLPERAVVWELNYRGALDFLQQARAQQASRDLTVVDGWRYFIHGWSQVVGDVFDLDMTPDLVDALGVAAEPTR